VTVNTDGVPSEGRWREVYVIDPDTGERKRVHLERPGNAILVAKPDGTRTVLTSKIVLRCEEGDVIEFRETWGDERD
jgi:hypothetical protein